MKTLYPWVNGLDYNLGFDYNPCQLRECETHAVLQRVWSWRDYATEEGELSWIPHFSEMWVHTSVVFGDRRNSYL